MEPTLVSRELGASLALGLVSLQWPTPTGAALALLLACSAARPTPSGRSWRYLVQDYRRARTTQETP